MEFYMDKELNGQSQCYGCRQKGKWHVEWSSMMWISKENGNHYCDECKKELEVDQMKKYVYEFYKKVNDKKPKFTKTIIARTKEDADNQAIAIAEQTSTFYVLKEE